MRLIDADQFGVISFQGKSEDFIEGVAFMFDKIHEAPTVERPHGEWIETDDGDEIYGPFNKCSHCGAEVLSTHMSYCGNCGAKMGEGDAND